MDGLPPVETSDIDPMLETFLRGIASDVSVFHIDTHSVPPFLWSAQIDPASDSVEIGFKLARSLGRTRAGRNAAGFETTSPADAGSGIVGDDEVIFTHVSLVESFAFNFQL